MKIIPETYLVTIIPETYLVKIMPGTALTLSQIFMKNSSICEIRNLVLKGPIINKVQMHRGILLV
jgi:hypothetical protein